MSQENCQTELQTKTQWLLDGPLKHIRGAALAAALLPLASVVVAPASAQTSCPGSAGAVVCGTVFNDVNHDGIQGLGEPGLPGVEVMVTDRATNSSFTLLTGTEGFYQSQPMDVAANDTVTLSIVVPTGSQVSPVPANCTSICSSGVLTNGHSATTVVVGFNGTDSDFGFFQNSAVNPGTGTIGYWKNHPEAWPVSTIPVGGNTYTVAQAISWFNKVGKDKTTMMFAQLVAAMLNVNIGNDTSCVDPTISAANAWLVTYPLGSNVAGSSYAWSVGQSFELTLDAYNNGLLCAPHRQ
jgi:SdrD B-like domain